MRSQDIAELRDSDQPMMPSRISSPEPGIYDLYPACPIGKGKIKLGYEALAAQIRDCSSVVIDGYVGVFWDLFRKKLDKALSDLGVRTEWIDMSDCMLPEEQIKALKKPFLGDDDPVFGTRYTGELVDFFDWEKMDKIAPSGGGGLCIICGPGAALVDWDAPLMYVDLPKNELQYRSRAGSIANLGMSTAGDPKAMYKQFYFIDWLVLNRHKATLADRVTWMVDEQNPDDPAIVSGDDFRESLEKMSQNFFRVRPWFEPGVWGGQWCKQHIPGLAEDVPNYAWSFEMIVPENGLLLSSDDIALEFSFDWLMYRHHKAVLGDSAPRFGYEFPIRFDLLDTFDGENLSLQCHPRPGYIKEYFGEPFTQDETYYIMDCKPGARVYLGFREDIEPSFFRESLQEAERDGLKVDVDNFVLSHPAEKHDLFLIPSGTIHCSGVDNLVLEISATPYIFTFKMYDWQRLDLDGNPRPINIERAFDNLQFDRKGQDKVTTELISTPTVLECGENWQRVHLPTHPEHFYDVHRYDFADRVEIQTNGSCHVMNLVEGESVILETKNGFRQRLNFAETFVVPAAAGSYHLINENDEAVKVIQAFIK